MTIGDSAVLEVKKISMNPMRSRSTIVCVFCILGILYLNLLGWQAGFYAKEMALVSIYILRDVMNSCLSHQKTELPKEPATP